MRCPRCQQENRDEARFRAACGSSLAVQCPACGHQLPPGAALCDHCGTPVAGSAPAATSPPLASRPQLLQAYIPKHLVEKILTSKAVLEGERKIDAPGKPVSLVSAGLARLEQALRRPGGFDSYEALRQWVRRTHGAEAFRDSLNLLLLDNNGAPMTQRLTLPENVRLGFLPPYCPEPNPIERVWRDLKDALASLQFSHLDN